MNAINHPTGTSLDALASSRRWVGWQIEDRDGKPTKVPYSPNRKGRAAADDPRTWGTRSEAEDRAKTLPRPHRVAGVGLVLGDLGDGRGIGGIDLDACRDASGMLAPFALEVIHTFSSYTEVSPSGTGVKLFFAFSTVDLPNLRGIMQSEHGRVWRAPGGGEHGQAIEMYLGGKYFAVTGEHLAGTPQDMRPVEMTALLWLIHQAGPRLKGAERVPASRHASRSEAALALGARLKREGATYEQMCDELRRHSDTAAWVLEKGDADGGRELRRIWAKAESPTEWPVQFHAMTVEELFCRSFPLREMVLSPWLPEKGLAMVYGPRGIGKTHLTLGVAYAVASGGSFLRWHAPRARKVLIIDGEMPAVVLQDRLLRIAAASPTEPPSPDYLRIMAMDLQERSLDLSSEAGQEALEAEIGDADVILVDNISTLTRGGRENEAESWLPVQQWALTQRKQGRSVVFVHHAGKGGQQRGTSRREDVLDSVLALRAPADHLPDQGARFEVHFEKSRGFHGDDAKPFEAALGEAGWTERDLEDADLDRVAKLTSEGLSARDIAEETGLSKSKVNRLQQRARALGMVTANA